MVRKYNIENEIARDQDFLKILSKNPSQVFKSIKQQKNAQRKGIKTLKVGNKVYSDENHGDGFYDGISFLKSLPQMTSPCFESFAEDHRHIIEICKSGNKIPRISVTDAEELLKQIRPGVTDYFSISAAHYLNGGCAAIRHFQFLFNGVLGNVELY